MFDPQHQTFIGLAEGVDDLLQFVVLEGEYVDQGGRVFEDVIDLVKSLS